MPIEDDDILAYQWDHRWDNVYEYDGYDGTYYQAQQEKMLEDERLRRQRYQEAQRRNRLAAASKKECSGCNQITWHDPDDYLCIVCRDGRSALPDGAHMPGMTAAV